jgi:SPP1 gp7 family putative phage head morphogenesis protein
MAINWALVNEAVIAWASQYTATVVAQITTTSMSAFTANFPAWYRSGQPLQALIDTLSPYYGPVRAEMVAVTEVTRAFAQGNILAWQASGVVDGVRWETGQDDLVCDICIPLAEKSGTLDGGVDGQFPPAHVNCRCYLQPVVNL